jgi:hypothetical protein
MSEVSIKTSTVADLSRMGWNMARSLERIGRAVAYQQGGNNDNKQKFYDAVVAEIVVDQGGTATTTNVNAALRDAATPEAAFVTIDAL